MSDNYFEDMEQKVSDESKIRSNPYYIRTLEQSEENCSLAVSLKFDALKCIPKTLHTEGLCLIAIRQCGYALKYVSKKVITEELCFEAVKASNIKVRYMTSNYNVFEFIPAKYLTPEFYKKSYEINPNILDYIPIDIRKRLNIAENNCIVVKQTDTGISLGDTSLRKITKQMCISAVKNNPLELEFVPDRFKTLELCELALEEDLKSITFFPKELLTKDYVQKWLVDVIDLMKNFDKRTEDIDYNRKIRELKNIISGFPIDINNDSEIIRLQRILGVREFTSKIYDITRKKFITTEKILNQYKTEEKEFSKFTQFYNYVDGDLSNANLYYFNFKSINLKEIDIKNALISSEILVVQELYDDTYYNSIALNDKSLITPLTSIKNENIDAQSLVRIDDIESTKLNNEDIKFYYISDIHLMHKIKKKFPKYATDKEVAMYVKTIVNDLKKSAESIISESYLLIGGDISLNFDISKLFYTEVSKQFKHNKIIVILGNHELWDAKIDNRNDELKYSTDSLQETISKYREMLKELKIHLLHNQLLVLKEDKIRISTAEQLQNISEQKLKEIALKSPFLLLAGLGFSGYDKKFNASCGLYRNKIVTLEDDLKETQKFEALYFKLKQLIPNEKLIVFTHTPKDNWSNDDYNKNWIYISGHTHKNEYTINDEKTVYSDNQIGYKSTSFSLKSFKISGTYNAFKHYEDGKHVIKRESYNEFNRGMRIQSVCNRAGGIIHMLKKYNNYCFFYEKNNKLYLLNGGAIKKAEHQTIDYYFEKLDVYSDAIKNMLLKYNNALKQISNEVKKIGGDGNIHGCIVDIDFFNHIYLNPIDGSITPYFATDIVNKKVFSSVPLLLKSNAPTLYNRYMQMLSNNKSTLSLKTLKDDIDIEISKYVFETAMYEPSRVMKSLQYITEANVIRDWNGAIISEFQNKTLNNQQCLE